MPEGLNLTPITGLDYNVGKDERQLFDEHTKRGYRGKRCGVTWGEMAPPKDKPGTLHWCMREMVEVPDPDGLATATPNPSGHVGRHRCECGDYAEQDATTRVVCRFPIDDSSGGTVECFAVVLGLHTEIVELPGSLSAGRKPQRFSIVRSTPCNHVVRRGF
jgi:hypothetical protein